MALPVDGEARAAQREARTMLWSLCREVQSQAKGLFDDNIPHGYIKLLFLEEGSKRARRGLKLTPC